MAARRAARTPAGRRRLAERRLRRTVARYSGCLDNLSALQERVLELRAGIGAGPARSRRGVARRLDLRPRRVLRLERTGLRRVRALVRGGTCGAGGSGDASGGAAGASRGDGGSTVLSAAGLGVDRSASSAEPGSGNGASGSGSGGESGEVRGEADTRVVPFPDGGQVGSAGPSVVPGGTPITIALALVLLAALAGFAAPQLRNRVRSG